MAAGKKRTLTEEKAYISLGARGQLTVPVALRRRLKLHQATRFEVIVEGDSLRLRPIDDIDPEDRWAYTPDHLRRLSAARKQVAAGQVQTALPDSL